MLMDDQPVRIPLKGDKLRSVELKPRRCDFDDPGQSLKGSLSLGNHRRGMSVTELARRGLIKIRYRSINVDDPSGTLSLLAV
jgi:hypothetical protein